MFSVLTFILAFVPRRLTTSLPAENGGAPEIFKTSWGLDRQ